LLPAKQARLEVDDIYYVRTVLVAFIFCPHKTDNQFQSKTSNRQSINLGHLPIAGNTEYSRKRGTQKDIEPTTMVLTFTDVTIREYPVILGDNPSPKIGAPVGLDWDYTKEFIMDVNEFEESRRGKRRTKPHHLYLSYYKRLEILESAGYTKKEFHATERQIQRQQWSRNFHYYWSFPVLVQKNVTGSMARRKNRRFIRKYRREMKQLNTSSKQ
jgi:hypothetical protein